MNGDAGVYFDPLSVEDFAARLKEIAATARLADLGPRGLAQAAQFDAARMAAPILDWVGAKEIGSPAAPPPFST